MRRGFLRHCSLSDGVCSSSMSTPISAVAEPCVTQEAIRQAGHQAWKMNSIALKSIRDSNENPLGVPSVEKIDLFHRPTYDIFTLERGEGEAYNLVEPLTPWSWMKMLNGMDDPTLAHIVGDGIRVITCQPIPGTSDSNRLHA